MSGITGSGEGQSPLKLKFFEEQPKVSSKKNPLEEGIPSAKFPKVKASVSINRASDNKEESINVKQSIDTVRERHPKNMSAGEGLKDDVSIKKTKDIILTPSKRRVESRGEATRPRLKLDSDEIEPSFWRERRQKSMPVEDSSKGVKDDVPIKKSKDIILTPSKRRVESKGRLHEETETRRTKERDLSSKGNLGKKFENPKIVERNKVINILFDHLSQVTSIPELRLNLEIGLTNFDRENQTISMGNHLVLVRKVFPNNTIVAIANVSKKAIALGGFGKIYSAKTLETNEKGIALKLSRKRLDRSLTNESKQIASTTPTQRGILAKESIEYEIGIINYICKNTDIWTGLNVNMYGQVRYNDQIGYFTKRFEEDGHYFHIRLNPLESSYEFMVQISKGLETLHKINIVHRDLKLENTLVKKNGNIINGTNSPSRDAVITDFGSALILDDLFNQTTLPSLNKVFGNGTDAYVSKRYYIKVGEKLEKLKKFTPQDKKYNEIITEIKQILIKNDKFAMGISLYKLWVRKPPFFLSFRENRHFEFDKGSTEKQKSKILKEMYQELLSVTYQLSLSLSEKGESIALGIINPIREGLGFKSIP